MELKCLLVSMKNPSACIRPGILLFLGFSTDFCEILTKLRKVVILSSGRTKKPHITTMKNRSLHWLMGTMLLIATAFLSNPTDATAKPAPTTSPGIVTDMPSALLLTTATEQIPIVNYQVVVHQENSNRTAETGYAETSPQQTVPILYAKRITGTAKNLKAMATGNHRGNAYNRMM